MHKNTALITLIGLTLAVGACGDATSSNDPGPGDSDDSSVDRRGGPESLVDYEWASEPREVNGVELQLTFEFTEDEVVATNTCDGLTDVTTSSPVRYTYTARIPRADSAIVEDGSTTCEVGVEAHEFTFEVVDDGLKIDDGNETFVAKPDGAHAGVYGEWEVETEVGTLTFQMNDGRLRAENACKNGLTAAVTVEANYTNHLVIEEASSNEKDGCTVSIADGTYDYRFDGEALVLDRDGETTRFER